MKVYDERIVNRLLDMYEKSTLSTGENRRTVHIDLNFTKKEIPEYFNTSSAAYETVHSTLHELERQGIVEILWKDGKTDHVVAKVRLLSAEKAYAYAGRTPKASLEEAALLILQEFLTPGKAEETPVTEAFARYLSDRIQRHASVREYMDLNDPEAARNLLHALRCVERNGTPCYLREFSVRCFHDSKYFEQMQQRITGIFRKFGSGYADMHSREILAEYGIYHTPDYVFFKGNAELEIGGKVLELQMLTQGIGISGDDLLKLRIPVSEKNQQIRRVMTIENLTAFFRFQEEDCLAIYLGGYHNGVRRELLKVIRKRWPQAEYLHFGDIDAGGFQILRDLREKTGIPFTAWRMDLKTLRRYEVFARPLTASDRTRLEALRGTTEWQEVIRYMLEKNIKLEQECISPLR